MNRKVLTCIVAIAALAAVKDTFSANDPVDQAVVKEKIKALGLRDDTLSCDEQPERWLTERCFRILPHLIEGLDQANLDSAKGCLRILDGAPPNAQVLDVLVRISASSKHPLCQMATISLCRYSDDPRAQKLLEAALVDSGRFPDPQHRSRFAEALGRKALAVALLQPLLDNKDDFTVHETIDRLGQIGDPSGIVPLEKASKNSRWEVASAAFQAMAKIDPHKHGLTAAQAEFLNEAGRSFKASKEFYQKRQKKLACLNRTEIRPLVMQMLVSNEPYDALGILRIWQDKEALPEIKRLMGLEKFPWHREFIAAFLSIDSSPDAMDQILKLGHQDNMGRYGVEAEDLGRAAITSDLPHDQKLALLRGLRDRCESRDIRGATASYAVPRCFLWMEGDRESLMSPMMEEEKDPCAMGFYAELTMREEKGRYSKGMARAMDLLTTMKEGVRTDDFEYAAQRILDACAYHEIAKAASIARSLHASSSPLVRLAAAHASVRLGGNREAASAVLCEGLGHSEPRLRQTAANYLLQIPCLDQKERMGRESLALELLGKPQEDYALRVLTTCAGEKSVLALQPLLNGEDVARSIHAAWVLAQSPDPAAAKRGIRRLAIFGKFRVCMGQQEGSEGISFYVAPDLRFGQATGRIHPKANPNSNPVQIPADLLGFFSLNKEEQAFAIRAFRHVVRVRNDREGSDFHGSFAGRTELHESWIPLLRVIAREDPDLQALRVKGQKVAHFPRRKAAAGQIAALNKELATYIGLGGEELPCSCVPSAPYKDQNVLVARFLMDQIQFVSFADRPSTGMEWSKWNYCDSLLRNKCQEWEFGEGLKRDLLKEAQRRNIETVLKKTEFCFWRNE
ncbi:MAG: HEAT repeat domain-containing protein [Verrucomicrobiae bacterium]|nr:HEAT repeat domain-containing protein [Verrucomicrobiae bacterium]